MDKKIEITRSGKAGREPGTIKERIRKHYTNKSNDPTFITDIKGPQLSNILCKILMGDSCSLTPTPDPLCTRVRNEIHMKLRSYKSSDTSRSLPGTSVNDHDIIAELMIRQKCRCYYCHKEFLVLYKNLRDPLQWSVDRIHNDRAHTQENIVISCLRCNLQRRTRDCDEFYTCRNLQISKVD